MTIEHVKFAEKICAASINENDPGLLTGAIDKESRKKTEDTKRIVKELMDRKGTTAALAGIETNEIKTTLKANDIQYSNSADLNIALRKLSFLTPQGSKWVYEKED